MYVLYFIIPCRVAEAPVGRHRHCWPHPTHGFKQKHCMLTGAAVVDTIPLDAGRSDNMVWVVVVEVDQSVDLSTLGE